VRHPAVTLLLLAFALQLPAQTQRLLFEHFSYAQGMPLGAINCLLEDRDGFIWIGGSRGLARFDGHSFEPFFYQPNDSCSLNSKTVNCLLQDRQGRIWAGTSNGISRLDSLRKCFDNIPFPSETILPADRQVNAVLMSKKGGIWVGASSGLYFFDDKNDRLIRSPGSFDGGVQAICEDHQERLWLASECGLYYLDGQGKAIHDGELPKVPGMRPSNVKDLFEDSQNHFWAGTENGLYRWDKAKATGGQAVQPADLPPILQHAWVWDIAESDGYLWVATRNEGLVKWRPGSDWQQYNKDALDPFSPADVHHKAVLHDHSGALWLGTFSGLDKTRFTRTHFPFFYIEPSEGQNTSFVMKMTADQQGGTWAYIRGRGLYHAKGLGQKAVKTSFPIDGFLDGKDHKGICPDSDGGIWIGRNFDGLYRATPADGTVRPFPAGDTLASFHQRSIREDATDVRYLWVATVKGLCRLDKKTRQRHWFYPQNDLPDLPDNAMNYLDQSPDGSVWLSFGYPQAIGIGRFDPKTRKFSKLEGGLPVLDLNQIRADGGQVWLIFEQQISRYDIASGSFSHFFPFREMSGTTLASAQPDDLGRLWFAGGRYIGCLDPADGSFRYFHQPEMEIFIGGSLGKLPDGSLVFGGKNGFCAFQPAKVAPLPAPPRPLLTSVLVNNQPSSLPTTPEALTSLTLPFADNTFSFGFVSLQLLAPANLRYAYRLDGFENDWQMATQGQRAFYTKVPPGRYTLRVRAASPDGVWGTEELALPVRILPPWWQTWWFRALCLIALAAAVFAFYQYKLRRRLEQEETRRLKELDTFKTRLYTNITHEFRTPLTLIVSPAARLKRELELADLPGPAEELARMNRQGQHLLRLVGQILDLNKLQAGKMTVNWVQGDVVAFLSYVADCFRSYAASKKIDLRFEPSVLQFIMDYDPEKWLAIVSNLLSNALKFTPEGGVVKLEIVTRNEGRGMIGPRDSSLIPHPSSLIISVSDTGTGIPADLQGRLFERFGSGTEDGSATGIGLSLVRELVRVMGGSIGVESGTSTSEGQGGGTIFTIKLPVHRHAKLEQVGGQRSYLPQLPIEEPTANMADLSNQAADSELPLLLLAEDHDDTAAYLAKCLSGNYRMLRARDGQEAIDLAFELIPDLVVSDLMMPRLDGFELCRQLKTDERTSHVPVVLLTSRTEVDAKLAGLRHGADDYLAKPFHEEELLARLQNLLNTRRRLQEAMAAALAQVPISAQPPTVQDPFLEKLWAAVDAHLDRSDFDVPFLCREIGMSRTQLHRKVTALTGESITKFIHTVRFATATRLLAQTQLTISEVAYECGFSDPGYFTKLFSKEFGKTPTEFREGVT
jgi:signal transduction histidine kinase/ligand-binding sensor domain-containing protein/DNA-binding response OmpR family regulator